MLNQTCQIYTFHIIQPNLICRSIVAFGYFRNICPAKKKDKTFIQRIEVEKWQIGWGGHRMAKGSNCILFRINFPGFYYNHIFVLANVPEIHLFIFFLSKRSFRMGLRFIFILFELCGLQLSFGKRMERRTFVGFNLTFMKLIEYCFG